MLYIKYYYMRLNLELARMYAKEHHGKRITKREMAKAIFPKNKHPYMAYFKLEKDVNQRFSVAQLQSIMRLTGIPLNMLIR